QAEITICASSFFGYIYKDAKVRSLQVIMFYY
ncbi:MAG: hypothetical protein ACI9Z4_002285, partial [Polaribacter sp.]